MIQTLNKPSWLGSEEGLVVKTARINNYAGNVPVVNGRQIWSSGTLWHLPNGALGILLHDVDITDGDKEAPVVVRGTYNEDILQYGTSTEYQLAKQGLFPIHYANTLIHSPIPIVRPLIETGDVISQLWFNTAKTKAEVMDMIKTLKNGVEWGGGIGKNYDICKFSGDSQIQISITLSSDKTTIVDAGISLQRPVEYQSIWRVDTGWKLKDSAYVFTPAVTVESVSEPDIWKDFISKEPFAEPETGGGEPKFRALEPTDVLTDENNLAVDLSLTKDKAQKIVESIVNVGASTADIVYLIGDKTNAQSTTLEVGGERGSAWITYNGVSIWHSSLGGFQTEHFNSDGMCTVPARSGAIGELKELDKGWNGVLFGKLAK